MDYAYISPGEVTSLQHELGDHTVETASLVAESLLTSAKSTEVLSGAGNDISEELENDAARGGYGDEGYQ